MLVYRWVASEFSSAHGCTFMHSVSTGRRECWRWDNGDVLIDSLVLAHTNVCQPGSLVVWLPPFLFRSRWLSPSSLFLSSIIVLSLYFYTPPPHFLPVPILGLASWIFSNNIVALMTHVFWFGLGFLPEHPLGCWVPFPLTFPTGSLLYVALISSFSEQIVLIVNSWGDFAIFHSMHHKILELGNNLTYECDPGFSVLQIPEFFI